MVFYKTKFHKFAFLKWALVLQILGWFSGFMREPWFPFGFVVLIWFYAKGVGNFLWFFCVFCFFSAKFWHFQFFVADGFFL